MKTILTLIITLTMFSANAQWADTTAREQVAHINLQLDKAHKVYRSGTYLVIAGLAINGLALLVGNDNGGGFLAGLGTLAILGGTAIHIDSHKYIGRTRLDD